MTDDELVKLLKGIQSLALVPYPWPREAHVNDGVLVAALGEIAGIASRAISRHEPKIERAPRG